MGDRISIQFQMGREKSVVLFNHWGGMEFKKTAEQYVKDLIKQTKGTSLYPLDRLEPNTVMVDFIRYITKDMERVQSSLHLGVDQEDGDNSDNGHHIIELKKE